jgi:hypothetical protein
MRTGKTSAVILLAGTWMLWVAMLLAMGCGSIECERLAAITCTTEQDRLAAINACGYSEQDKANLRDKLTWIGMTAEQARLANGEPDHIDRSVTAAGVCERWVYGADLRRPTFVYITNGKVSGWQN